MNIPRPLMILILGFLVVTLAAHAQPVGNVARLGYISGADPQLAASSLEAFRQGLRALGWIEGQNLRIEYRWAHGEFERFPQFAADLVHLKVDVIVASGPAALRALQQATSSIPIVSAVVLEDPVREGLVTSLAHPGGNLTGLASQYEEIVTKQIELLAEAVPKLSRVVILHHRRTDTATSTAAAAAVEKLALTARVLGVSEVGDFEGTLRTARDDGAEAVLVLPSPFFNAHRRVLITLAAAYRLPTCYEFKEYVQDGGLMSYGPSIPDMFRRAASYVDRILKGAKPSDLPIERPDKFELAINLKTAEALGLTIPPIVLFQADKVIR
jgi:putative tryptophan/tyrosine transport system substrate-binding protein